MYWLIPKHSCRFFLLFSLPHRLLILSIFNDYYAHFICKCYIFKEDFSLIQFPLQSLIPFSFLHVSSVFYALAVTWHY